jgi:hypothetical protein
MFQIQLRYFQYILSISIALGFLLDNTQLITAAFVGIVLTWVAEMLSAQFEITSEKYLVILIVLLLSFSSVIALSYMEMMNINVLFIVLLIFSLTFFLFQQDVNIYKIGNVFFVLVVSFLVNGFLGSQEFFDNINLISILFVTLLTLKTLATYLNIQFSNFQFYFNFFAVVVVMGGVSSFYTFETLDIILASITVGLLTTLLNFLFIKIRFEYELTSSLSSQIFIFDYLVAFIISIYAVDALNILNGLF